MYSVCGSWKEDELCDTADPHVRMYDSHWPLHFVGYAFTSMLDLFRGDIDGQAQLIWLLRERLVVTVYIFMLWLRFTRLNWRNCHKFANIAWTETTKTTKMRKTTNVRTLRVYFYIHIYLYAHVYMCDRYEIYTHTYVCISGIETNSNEYRSRESWNIVSYPTTTR